MHFGGSVMRWLIGIHESVLYKDGPPRCSLMKFRFIIVSMSYNMPKNASFWKILEFEATFSIYS